MYFEVTIFVILDMPVAAHANYCIMRFTNNKDCTLLLITFTPIHRKHHHLATVTQQAT